MTPSDRRCRYCGGPHWVSDAVFEESPFCAACLNERVARANGPVDGEYDDEDGLAEKRWALRFTCPGCGCQEAIRANGTCRVCGATKLTKSHPPVATCRPSTHAVEESAPSARDFDGPATYEPEPPVGPAPAPTVKKGKRRVKPAPGPVDAGADPEPPVAPARPVARPPEHPQTSLFGDAPPPARRRAR